jgi:hypothetical protein
MTTIIGNVGIYSFQHFWYHMYTPSTQNKQHMQCTYNILLRHIRATIVWVENKFYIYWVCICSLRYPACNVNVPYPYLWPAWLYSIFPHYLTNGTLSLKKKKLLNIKCVFDFFTSFVKSVSHSKKNWARYDQKCIFVFM